MASARRTDAAAVETMRHRFRNVGRFEILRAAAEPSERESAEPDWKIGSAARLVRRLLFFRPRRTLHQPFQTAKNWRNADCQEVTTQSARWQRRTRQLNGEHSLER